MDPLKMTENAVVHIQACRWRLIFIQTRSMCIKLAHHNQTDSRRRKQTQEEEEDENGGCKGNRIFSVDPSWGRTAAATHTQLQDE